MERTFELRFAPSAPADAAQPGGGVTEKVRAAVGGDQDAFADLYRDFARMVHGILLARVRRADVDDLVQDVFATAFARLSSLRDPAAFGGWLATIARHRGVDYQRHAPDEVPLPRHLPGGVEVAPAAVEALEAIRSLPDAYRETLMMRLVEGMTGAEIAERSGLTPASVRVNLHRGMKQLRQRLGWNGRD